MRTLKDSASADSELLSTVLALVIAIVPLSGGAVAIAMRTNDPIGPTAGFNVFDSGAFVREGLEELVCGDCRHCWPSL